MDLIFSIQEPIAVMWGELTEDSPIIPSIQESIAIVGGELAEDSPSSSSKDKKVWILKDSDSGLDGSLSSYDHLCAPPEDPHLILSTHMLIPVCN